MLDAKHKGALAEQRAIVWFLEQGYEVFSNVSQHGTADLVVRKDGAFIPVDVTTGHWRTRAGGAVDLHFKKFTDPTVKGLVMDPDGQFSWYEFGTGQSMPRRGP